MLYNHLETKRALKFFLILIGCCSLLSPILSFLLWHYFKIAGPLVWLPLSLYGWNYGYFWQIFTYPLIHSPSFDFSISLLLSTSLHLYILWYLGQELTYRFSSKAFWWILGSSTIVCAAVGLLTLWLVQPTSLVFGTTPLLFTLGTLYVLCYPNLQFQCLNMISLKALWIALLLFALCLLSALTSGYYALFAADLAGLAWGYFIGRMILKLPMIQRL